MTVRAHLPTIYLTAIQTDHWTIAVTSKTTSPAAIPPPSQSQAAPVQPPLPPPPTSSVKLYELTFGTVCGICAGVFVKKGARIVAFALGGVFVLLQVSIPPGFALALRISTTDLLFAVSWLTVACTCGLGARGDAIREPVLHDRCDGSEETAQCRLSLPLDCRLPYRGFPTESELRGGLRSRSADWLRSAQQPTDDSLYNSISCIPIFGDSCCNYSRISSIVHNLVLSLLIYG